MCAENIGESSSEMFFLLNPEDAIKEIKRNGYILMPEEELPGFDMNELDRLVEQEGFKTDYELIYDPNRMEITTINTIEKGPQPQDMAKDGWRETRRRIGEYARLIREKQK